MNCLGCLARHVLMIYIEKPFRLSYMQELAVRYKVDLEALKEEVTRLHKSRNTGEMK
jgi:hypothetical protein